MHPIRFRARSRIIRAFYIHIIRYSSVEFIFERCRFHPLRLSAGMKGAQRPNTVISLKGPAVLYTARYIRMSGPFHEVNVEILNWSKVHRREMKFSERFSIGDGREGRRWGAPKEYY